ncbi:hypothetical protein C2845_PM16G01070 [Panicum miliaceum]|uniref:Rx N-terminal domain-containing protein n=1 Tax=Panicum miliaceum TaxID=4540 RepID=A0A3L6PU79_PANMI|nr:hypothetical protein C2845_PM16G01070 [Panicum miliaceum]
MAELAAVGWAMSALGWIASPITTRLLNDGVALLRFDESEKLRDLEARLLPQLALMLEKTERIPTGQMPHVELWAKRLRAAFYNAEDILNVADYHRLENQMWCFASSASPGPYKSGRLQQVYASCISGQDHYLILRRHRHCPAQLLESLYIPISLNVRGLPYLTGIPPEVMESLHILSDLSIDECLQFKHLQDLNRLSRLQHLRITNPNLATLEEADKLRILHGIATDSIAVVPQLLSGEGCSSLSILRTDESEEPEEEIILEKFHSLTSLRRIW